ncbi:MAG: YCF48-related protein [Bacteroidota bacterium]|nr:YCF48-related protein [Bacteroidota bacterium]
MKTLYILIFAFLQTSTVFAESGWQFQTSGTNVYLRSVHFTSSLTGWVAGESGTILKTTNGGNNWSAQSSGTALDLYSIHFPSSSTGYACGINGIILKTIDGGNNWNIQTSGTTEYLNSIYFTSSSGGWAVGANGIILRTANGGTNWNPQSSGTTEYLFSTYFTSAAMGWAVGGSPFTKTIILKTTNLGVTWFPQEGKAAGLLSVNFASADTGCAVGTFGNVLYTTNAGTNWNDGGSQQHLSGLNSVHFFSGTTGWMTSSLGKIYKTTTSGWLWYIQEIDNINNLNDIYFTSSNTGWAVGSNGNILKTTNGGTSTFHFNLSVLPEGFYDTNSGVTIGDIITVTPLFIAPYIPPTQPAQGFLDSTGHCTLTFYNADHSTPFYFKINHRNSIETWSATWWKFSSFSFNYDFTTAASQAYGSNQIFKGTRYCIYGGDVNQDGTVDLNDNQTINNDAYNFASGYIVTDLNGDNLADVSDATIADNNAHNFISKITPYGY